MLENSKAYSGFAVSDLEKSKQFYGDTLGLKIKELDVGAPQPLLELDPAGDRPILIYEKGDLAPANYGFDQDEKGIDRSGPAGGIAWFKDPAGNILSVHGQM
jgi:catechol 2,3-dioxygenase-like lactoylglutathione lyase family enzyme